jgi:hypothetical protein
MAQKMKFILFPFLALLCLPAFAAEKIPLPTAHTTRNIEGWTVRVDDRLLRGDGAAVGERALKLLTSRLVAITIVVPEKSLAKLRAITIELDLGQNDFYPFVTGELKQAEPETFALLADIWGPLPGSAPSKPVAKK